MMTCYQDDLLAMFVAFFLLGMLIGLVARSVSAFIESASTIGSTTTRKG